ncbi:unnamed protein product [Brassica rapa]|uniref:Uncharacterized protein n=1 Tax=Brassica campestris TaxID=3711 RepID=A0A8D9G006_BRACM|nr:unnamed protein product [Brassica rapa]
MDSHGRPVYADGHTRTHTDSHGHPRTTNVLICVLMDSHGRPVCADGHRRTRIDTHVQPRASCVCWRTPTDVLCVLNRQPTWAKITRTVHGKGQRAESKDQRADMCTDGQPRTSCTHTDTHGQRQTATDVVCVLTDSQRQPRTSCVCWWTPMDVLCVLNRQLTRAKITQTVHGKGQLVESMDKRADMYTDGQPQTSCVSSQTHTDTNRQPRTSCVCWRTPTDVLCVLNRQPTWAKITRTVHRKGQRAESKDQHADMCTDGQPQTSCVC